MRHKDPERMMQIQQYSEAYYREHGVPPVCRDIAGALGISKSTVQRYLAEMDNRGLPVHHEKARKTEPAPAEMQDPMQARLQLICDAFRIPGRIICYSKLNSGNINATYSVTCCEESGRTHRYLVQRVNTYVFRDPVSMMGNISRVTEHITRLEPDSRHHLHFHHTAEGNNYLYVGEEFWRVCNYVENAVSFDTGEDPKVLNMAGHAFGKFEAQLSGFDASVLVETIPKFHNTPSRLETFFTDVQRDPENRCSNVWSEIGQIAQHRELACRLQQMCDSGELPLRVTHNDTKTNNVLFDKESLEPLVVIDLDTVMPGMAAFDFGDTIRFAANTAAEDEPDLSRVSLDLDLFRAFAEGYLSETAGILTQPEIDTMVLGALTVTMETATRFLDDYITGDKYFKTYYPTHNLVRARCQLALFRDMLRKREQMEEIVRTLTGGK